MESVASIDPLGFSRREDLGGMLRPIPAVGCRHRWESNSVWACTRMCSSAGFSYAGLEWSSECYCGHTAPPSHLRQPQYSLSTLS